MSLFDNMWDTLADTHTEKVERKVIGVTEDFNIPEMSATTTSQMSNELQIYEYRDPSNMSHTYCPVYKCGATSNNGITYTSYISGQITDVDNYVVLIDTMLTMTANDIIYLFIDSPGGYIASGGLVASAIDKCEGKVFTIARGLCASAAALIHSSAKAGQATVTPFAVMLYHMSSHCDAGVSTHIAQSAEKQVRYVNETLLSKALQDGHITKEEFGKIQTGEDIIIPADEWMKRTHQGETTDE